MKTEPNDPITEGEYLEAKEIIERYEEQLKQPPVISICPECNEEWVEEKHYWICKNCRDKYRAEQSLNTTTKSA